jgi:hypothetical protein
LHIFVNSFGFGTPNSCSAGAGHLFYQADRKIGVPAGELDQKGAVKESKFFRG